MLSAPPNISPDERCLGIWSTVVAEWMFFEPSALLKAGPYISAPRLWALGLPR